MCVYDAACKPVHSDFFDFFAEVAAAPEHLKAVVRSTDAIPYRSKVSHCKTFCVSVCVCVRAHG